MGGPVSTPLGLIGWALCAFGASGDAADFGAFVLEHSRTYQPGTSEYEVRRQLFEAHALEVEQLNSLPDRLWTATLGRFADYTEEELAGLRGYHPGARPAGGPSPPTQLLDLEPHKLSLDLLPRSFSWKEQNLQATSNVWDQQGCGSCWAFAASTVLQAHSELYQRDRQFSQQQIVACTQNPQHCGGDGGCTGATIELALDYVQRKGCSSPDSVPYLGVDSKCPTGMAEADVEGKSFLSIGRGRSVAENAGARFGMVGYQKLPENQLAPLFWTLYEQGPVGISVSAGYKWSWYTRGIMGACNKNVVINHAVVLVGYGEERGRRYWQIQNSWGRDWGEGGFIRLSRHDHHTEAKFCGLDEKPEEGSGCRGGPKTVTVCGTCGILYDAVVPTFELSAAGWWALSGRKRANGTQWAWAS